MPKSSNIDRSTKRQLAPWVWRMGMSKGSHTAVYWLRGLGYFVAPRGLLISTRKSHIAVSGYVIFINSDGSVGRKQISRGLHQDDNEHNIRKIREACEYVGRNGELYSHSVQNSWLRGIPSVNRIPGMGVQLFVHTCLGVADKYPPWTKSSTSIHKYSYFTVGSGGFKKGYREAETLKKEMVQLFKDRYKKTVDEVMVFHDTCPELIETTNT